MRIPPGLLIACVLAFPAFATAQTDLSSDDIVRHFKAQTEAPPPPPPPAGAHDSGNTSGTTGGTTRAVHFGASGYGDGNTATADPTGPTAAEAAAAADEAYNLLVTFDVDSDRLTPRAQRNLAQFAEALRNPALAGYRFVVEGHTDSSGPDDYNLTLSERRANAVVRYLTDLGVDPARLEARGYGETRPAAPGSNRENRRVETRLSR